MSKFWKTTLLLVLLSAIGFAISLRERQPVFGALSVHSALAADCDNCPRPSVGLWDFRVTVPQPTQSSDMNSPEFKAYMRWLDLFFAGGGFNDQFFQQDPKRSCLDVLDGMVATGNVSQGNTIPANNFPPSACPVGGADYFVDGQVGGADGAYTLTVAIKDGVTCEVVAQTSVPFTDSKKSMDAGRQAAAQLSPVFDKIRDYQKRKRDASDELAIHAEIEIRPAKEKMDVGETQPVEVFLYDCDGRHPLKNRKVSLTSNHGTLSPAEVTTDAAGKAKAQFTAQKAGLATLKASYFPYTTVTHKQNGADAHATVQVGDLAGLWRLDIDASLTDEQSQRKSNSVGGGVISHKYERFTVHLTALYQVKSSGSDEIYGSEPVSISGGGRYVLDHFGEFIKESMFAWQKEGTLDLSDIAHPTLTFDIRPSDQQAAVTINDFLFKTSTHKHEETFNCKECHPVDASSEETVSLPPMAAESKITRDARTKSYKVTLDKVEDHNDSEQGVTGKITRRITATIRFMGK